MQLSEAAIEKFQNTIYEFYQTSGKKELSWRNTKNPYYIFVSEIMLQQTQVPRVEKKYPEFLQNFPTIYDLADARLQDVLIAWSGLGYNRRGMFLKQAAEQIVSKYNGIIPTDYNNLISLPGIGDATAAQIRTFAFNIPNIIIETNIRTVYIYWFFHNTEDVTDSDLKPLIEQTLDQSNPRIWYYALMDYGSMLKKTYGNLSRKSKHYTKQSKFKGSNREARGRIIKSLTNQPLTIEQLQEDTKLDTKRLNYNLERLQQEGMVKEEREIYKIRAKS